MAELEAAEAEASGDAQRSKRGPARSRRGARERAEDAQRLALETSLATGLESTCSEGRSQSSRCRADSSPPMRRAIPGRTPRGISRT